MSGSKSLNLFFCAALACSAALLACSGPARRGREQRYELKGKVVSVDRAKGKVTIAHEEIPGFMGAMAMPFSLKDRDAFEILAEGDRIQATLVVADNDFWLENPVITKGLPEDGAGGSAAASAEPQAGAAVPDFSLLNQDAKPIRLHQYQGRALLLTFIYTRCPLPEYCTLMSTNFAEISRALQNDPALRARTHLLSVSIDPAHDTPKVLRSYGAAHTEKYSEETFEHWEFATGEPAEIKRMAEFFGLRYYSEQDQIIHSLSTAIIAPDGRVYKLYRGNEWRPSEVLHDLQSLLGEK